MNTEYCDKFMKIAIQKNWWTGKLKFTIFAANGVKLISKGGFSEISELIRTINLLRSQLPDAMIYYPETIEIK